MTEPGRPCSHPDEKLSQTVAVHEGCSLQYHSIPGRIRNCVYNMDKKKQKKTTEIMPLAFELSHFGMNVKNLLLE